MLAVLDHPTLGYNKEFLISCLFNNLAFFTQFGFFSDMVWLFSPEMSDNPVLNALTEAHADSAEQYCKLIDGYGEIIRLVGLQYIKIYTRY